MIDIQRLQYSGSLYPPVEQIKASVYPLPLDPKPHAVFVTSEEAFATKREALEAREGAVSDSVSIRKILGNLHLLPTSSGVSDFSGFFEDVREPEALQSMSSSFEELFIMDDTEQQPASPKPPRYKMVRVDDGYKSIASIAPQLYIVEYTGGVDKGNIHELRVTFQVEEIFYGRRNERHDTLRDEKLRVTTGYTDPLAKGGISFQEEDGDFSAEELAHCFIIRNESELFQPDRKELVVIPRRKTSDGGVVFSMFETTPHVAENIYRVRNTLERALEKLPR